MPRIETVLERPTLQQNLQPNQVETTKPKLRPEAQAMEMQRNARKIAVEIIRSYFELLSNFNSAEYEISPIINEEILNLDLQGVDVQRLVTMYLNSNKEEFLDKILQNTQLVKSLHRIVEKITNEIKILDLVRMRLNSIEEYTDKDKVAQDIIKSLQILLVNKNIEYYDIRRSVKSGGYSDFKIEFIILVNGKEVTFEVQINTKACCDAGKKEHKVYEQKRVLVENFIKDCFDSTLKGIGGGNVKLLKKYLDCYVSMVIKDGKTAQNYLLDKAVFNNFTSLLSEKTDFKETLNEIIRLTILSKTFFVGIKPVVTTEEDAEYVINKVKSEFRPSLPLTHNQR